MDAKPTATAPARPPSVPARHVWTLTCPAQPDTAHGKPAHTQPACLFLW